MKKYLLTFKRDGYNCYIWFDNVEEMERFIELNGEGIEVTERLNVLDAQYV